MGRFRLVFPALLISLAFSCPGCSNPGGTEGLSTLTQTVSELPEDIVRHITGADYVEYQNCRVEGTNLVLNPDGGAEMAWAMYRIDEKMNIRPIDIVFRTVAETETEYWVGLSDYTLGTWEMYRGSTAEDLVINMLDSWDYYSDINDVITYIVITPPHKTVSLIEAESRSNSYFGPTPPEAPGWVTAGDGEYPDRINVKWGQVQYSPNYRIERADSLDGEPVESSWTAVYQTQRLSFVDANVAPGQAYHYRVRGMNGNGFGEYSVTARGATADQ